jgi:hypothetical protein
MKYQLLKAITLFSWVIIVACDEVTPDPEINNLGLCGYYCEIQQY